MADSVFLIFHPLRNIFFILKTYEQGKGYESGIYIQFSDPKSSFSL